MINSNTATLTVSVIIPTYNRAEYLRDAVESALHQTQVPHEILVIDDGSTDNTPEILARYPAPVRVIRQQNRGRSVARNVGLDQATGDAVMFLDSDDMLLPTSVEHSVAAMQADPRIGVVYGDALVVDQNGNAVELYSEVMPGERPSGMILGALSRRCFITVSSLVRRSCLDGVRFEESMSCAEDYDFWRRLAGICEFKFLDEPLMCYRHHETMTINAGISKALNAELEVQQRAMQMASFEQLPRIERARTYCAHGAKNAVLDRRGVAQHYFAKAIWTCPLHPGGYVLGGLSLLGNRALKYAIMKRRQAMGNQLGLNVSERAHLGASKSSLNPAFTLAQKQLAAFNARTTDRN
jgi:glycosyltransferase involved in cell wall biosynthesis